MEAGLFPPQPAACALGTSWYHMAHGVRALGGLSWGTFILPGKVGKSKQGARNEPGGI